MTDQQIPHEAKFLSALGIDPDTVLSGSVHIQWQDGRPLLQWTTIVPVDIAALGAAFLASAQHAPVAPEVIEPDEQAEAAGQQEEDGPQAGVTQIKKAVKKTAIKQPKKEEAGESAD